MPSWKGHPQVEEADPLGPHARPKTLQGHIPGQLQLLGPRRHKAGHPPEKASSWGRGKQGVSDTRLATTLKHHPSGLPELPDHITRGARTQTG